jgi:hypothetical protein
MAEAIRLLVLAIGYRLFSQARQIPSAIRDLSFVICHLSFRSVRFGGRGSAAVQ